MAKAGIKIRSGSSMAVAVSIVSGVSTWARSQYIRSVLSLVLRIMNSFRGVWARSSASLWEISSST